MYPAQSTLDEPAILRSWAISAIYDRQSRVSAIVLSVARIYQPFIELHSLSARFKRKRAAIVLE